jgi:hypothetical protein
MLLAQHCTRVHASAGNIAQLTMLRCLRLPYPFNAAMLQCIASLRDLLNLRLELASDGVE